jgi:uncharacterized protein YjiS (DUF1127 family)
MFGSLKDRIAKYKRYNRTVKELMFLSDRELTDLGISRSDIRRIAREAAR